MPCKQQSDIHVLDKRAEVDTVKSFRWIVEEGVVDVIDGGGKLVASDGDGQYKPVGCPSLACGDGGGLYFLLGLGSGAGGDARV